LETRAGRTVPGLQERLLASGPGALTDPELLAVLFSEGGPAGLAWTSALASGEGGLKALCARESRELVSRPGFGRRRAALLSAAVELGRRLMRPGESRPLLRTPEEIFRHLAPTLCGLRREVFHVLCLNSRNALVADVRVAQGGINACPVDPREVFHAAICHKASAVVLVHNHPSGDATPSDSDVQLTRQLVQGARLLCIRVLDHLVLGDWTWSSMAQSGLMARLNAEGDGTWGGGR
jgi:DNA repair protein RadC